ncbi:deoxyguanosinetriphosphate triphosphohydrolase family protein [Pontixanthobacter aquaemixtae]|uniref:DNTP triphosphohydrolase n=1 Tax=Pontixanthobacter aquaemixtae TaxID=1958940 RepID=A0A844ZYQ1_9SPHN|nr:dNTP triphosphohydrolase [Pontixanthobacter aquaemixtae]MXO90589.1 dNTP triphosphohydrolase [Pontixanthobacter aquaemixtae]
MANLKREDRRHKQKSNDQRTPFEKDRDRILYSSAFQRLAGITQIVRAGEADVFHTRQQHSIKVAQIGRRLAQHLKKTQADEARHWGLDEEVVEAACLAHDLGHPPFGHVGEKVLHDLVQDHGQSGGFEGNAQSFRILTKLAVRLPDDTEPGLDLTRATLNATLKYPWMWQKTGKASRKWSAYKSEKEDFDFAREGFADNERSLEADLMDWCDDVAYSVHDLEDFQRCNAIPWANIFEDPSDVIAHAAQAQGAANEKNRKRLTKVWEELAIGMSKFETLLLSRYDGSREQREQLRRMTSDFIGKFIVAPKLNKPDSAKNITIDPRSRDEVDLLKQITRDYIISSPTLMAQQRGQREVLTKLYEILKAEAKSGKTPNWLPVRLQYLRDLSEEDDARFVCDCISSLTESETVRLHARLTGTTAGSVLDPIVR